MTLGNSPRKSCGNKMLVATFPLLIASLAVGAMSLNKLNETTQQLTETSSKLSDATALLESMQNRVELMAHANEVLAAEFAELKVSLTKDQRSLNDSYQSQSADLMSRFSQQLKMANEMAISGGSSIKSMDADVIDSMLSKVMNSIPNVDKQVAESAEQKGAENKAANSKAGSSENKESDQLVNQEPAPQPEKQGSADGAPVSATVEKEQVSDSPQAAGEKG